MFDNLLYWALLVVVVAAVIIKTRESGGRPIVQFLGAALVLVLAAIGIGLVFDGTPPWRVLLLRPDADIYSVFLVSVAYGLLIRTVIWAIQRRSGRAGES